tara:strand:- start:344 stop:694 length:351 start_codon:yes stop_codon:yes gene_type:complete
MEHPDKHTADLFSLAEGKRRRNKGMDAATEGRESLLQEARDIARACARYSDDGCATADDVARVFAQRDLDYSLLGNAAGSIFKGSQWLFTGEYMKSTRASAHARDIKVWRLSGCNS